MARPELSPYALSTVARARDYLKHPASVLSDMGEDVVVMALNAVAGMFERETGRKLACRTYRDPVTLSCTATASDETLTVVSGFSALKTLDDAVGSNLAAGSRIAAITSDSALELSKKATATGAVNVTFGSEPLVVNGSGRSVIYVPVRPVVEVYGAKWVDSLGVKTALDITGARLDRETGRYLLMQDVFPKGNLNIELEVKAGYRQPTATDRGDWEMWSHLESLCLRAVQVMFQDYYQQAGRTGEISLAQATMRIQDFKLPEDIQRGLQVMVEPW